VCVHVCVGMCVHVCVKGCMFVDECKCMCCTRKFDEQAPTKLVTFDFQNVFVYACACVCVCVFVCVFIGLYRVSEGKYMCVYMYVSM